MFEACAQYGFNKGHSTAYSLISVEEAYYLAYHAPEYFFAKIKYVKEKNYNAKTSKQNSFCSYAFQHGVVTMLPHVNYSEAYTSMRVVDGEKVIQKGLVDIDGVGEKAAKYIVEERNKNGQFGDYDDFYDRCSSRTVHKGVIKKLTDCGAADIIEKNYYERNVTFNAMFARRGA